MRHIRNDHYEALSELFHSANESLLIVTPFIKRDTIDHLIDKIDPVIEITVLTNITFSSIKYNATDLSALRLLRESFQRVDIYINTELHAKIYIADDKRALVTSANLTESGLKKNYEYGFELTNYEQISTIKRSITELLLQSTPLHEFQISYKENTKSRIQTVDDYESVLKSLKDAEFSSIKTNEFHQYKIIPFNESKTNITICVGDIITLNGFEAWDGNPIQWLIQGYTAYEWDGVLTLITVNIQKEVIKRKLEAGDEIMLSFKRKGEWCNPKAIFMGYYIEGKHKGFAAFDFRTGTRIVINKKRPPHTVIRLLDTNLDESFQLSEMEFVECMLSRK